MESAHEPPVENERQIQTPGPAHFLSEELRRELGNAIDRRREADARAKAAKVTANKAEALMCATAEKVAYGVALAVPAATLDPTPDERIARAA